MENSKYYEEALEQYKEIQQDTELYDERIIKTGCYLQNFILQLCHADTGDWRQCTLEMNWFKDCWAKNGNDKRTFQSDKSKEQYEREVRE